MLALIEQPPENAVCPGSPSRTLRDCATAYIGSSLYQYGMLESIPYIHLMGKFASSGGRTVDVYGMETSPGIFEHLGVSYKAAQPAAYTEPRICEVRTTTIKEWFISE